MVYDSGSTAPFTGSEDAMMQDSIVTLPKPIPVKMGAANTFATKTGIIPFCLEDKLNSSVGIMCLVRFFLVPDFFKDLMLIPQRLFELANWVVVGTKNESFMYKTDVSLKNSADSMSHTQDVVQDPKYASHKLLIHTAGNGLKLLKTTTVNKFKYVYDYCSGNQVPHSCLDNNIVSSVLSKHCTVVHIKSTKNAHFVQACLATGLGTSDPNFAPSSDCCNKGNSTLPRPSPEPPPTDKIINSPIMRVIVVGIGLCSELMIAFNDMPVKVVGLIEVGSTFKYAKGVSGDDVQCLHGLEESLDRIKAGLITLVPHDGIFFTLPCYDETSMKELNKYGTTKTAKLFRTVQHDFVAVVKPKYVCMEMTPPRKDYSLTHEAVLQGYRDLNYYVASDICDACTVGDHTSHTRWFGFCSTSPISSFNISIDSGMDMHPGTIENILEPEESIPQELYISHSTDTGENSEIVQFAPALVMRVFNSSKTGCCTASCILSSENALACTLLAWNFSKLRTVPLCNRLLGISTKLGRLNWATLHSPTDFFIFSLLRRHFKDSMCFQITLASASTPCETGTLRFGVQSYFDSVCFDCHPIRNTIAVPVAEIVGHMNFKCPGSARLASGGEIVYIDARNELRSGTTCATLAHTWASVGKKQKGSTICSITGPVPTLTRDANVIIDVTSRFPNAKQRMLRHLTVTEAARAKCFSQDCIDHLLSLSPADAHKKIALAVPINLLKAVYLTWYKEMYKNNLNALVQISECAFLAHIDSSAKHVDAFAAAAYAPKVDSTAPIQFSKRKTPRHASVKGWRTMPDPSSLEYAKTRRRVDHIHRIYHRSSQQLENDIAAGCHPSLQPGDTRFMAACPLCDANKPHISMPSHNPEYHENELTYGPGEAVYIDLWHNPTASRFGHYTLHAILVDMVSGLILDYPLRGKSTPQILEAFTYFKCQLRLEFGRTLKLIVTDSAAEFKERRVLSEWKIKHNICMQILAPILHHHNRAEGAIKYMRNGAVVRAQQVMGVKVQGKQLRGETVLPEAIRHAVICHNDSVSSSYKRKTDVFATPRQICAGDKHKVRPVPIYPFGARVTYVDPNQRKDQLRGLPMMYLCPSHYHEKHCPLSATDMGVLLNVFNGRITKSRDFRVDELSPTHKTFIESKIQGENRHSNSQPQPTSVDGSCNTPISPGNINLPPPPQVRAPQVQYVPIPVQQPCAQYDPKPITMPCADATQPPANCDVIAKPGMPSSSVHRQLRFETPEQTMQSPMSFRDIYSVTPAPPSPRRSSHQSRSTDGKSLPEQETADFWINELRKAPSVSMVPSPRSKLRNTDLDNSPPRPSSSITPIIMPAAPPDFPGRPRLGRDIMIKNVAGEFDRARVIGWGNRAKDLVNSAGMPLGKQDMRVIRRGDTDPESYDVRPSRFEDGYWKYPEDSNLMHLATGSNPKNTSLLSYQSRKSIQTNDINSDTKNPELISAFYKGNKLIATDACNHPKLASANIHADAKVVVRKVPGTDKIALVNVTRKTHAHTPFMHSLLLACMALATSDIIPHSKLRDTRPSARVHRLKPFACKFLCDDPCRVVEQASDVRSYLALGGSHETLKYERAMNNIRLGDERFDTTGWIDDIVFGHAELDSSFFVQSDLSSPHIVNQAESLIEKAHSAYLLWDVGLVSAYDLVRSHHRTLIESADSLDSPGNKCSLEHLYCAHFDVEHEKNTDLVLSYCQDKFAEIEVCMQLTIEGDTSADRSIVPLCPEDIVYDAETILELKDEPLEHKESYLKAIMKEFGDLCRNQCFSLEVVPDERSMISTKIVLKLKRKGDGSFDKFKARCVVRGFLAKIGLDFYATYSPMASLTTSRMLMALAVHHGLPVHHADIPQAFIQTELNRDIYIKFPRGVSVREDLLQDIQEKYPDSKIGIRLLRSLYGLKQAPMLWNSHLNSVLVGAGYERSKNDTSFYVHTNGDKFVALAVFVDDILVTGNDTHKIQELKALFEEKFRGDNTWDESVNSFLGMQIEYSGGVLSMNVQAKIEDLFDKYPFLKKISRYRNTPHGPVVTDPPNPEDDSLTDFQVQLRDNFASIVGSCIYFSVTCRPDISTIVGKSCQGMHNPKKIHVMYLELLVQYLKEHKDVKLTYSRHSLAAGLMGDLSKRYPELVDLPQAPIVGFSDANWLSKVESGERMRSVSGSCFYCFGNLVQWSSKRQSLTAGSTMEAELIAASSAADSAVWYHSFQESYPLIFGITGKPESVPLLIDNQAALSVANHPVSSPRTRHICLREFRIRDFHEAGKVRPFWCPGTHNVADHFSKLLEKVNFHKCRAALGCHGSNLPCHEFPPLRPLAGKPKVETNYSTEFFLDKESKVYCWHSFLDWKSPQANVVWKFWNLTDGKFPSNYVAI